MGRMSSGARPQLLILEDDEAVAASLVRLFASNFETVVAMTLGQAAAELEDPLRFGGAVIDILLPDGSGLDALTALRKAGAACPVLVLTAAFERQHASAAQLHGAEFLPKPPELANLFAFARRVTAFARTRDQRVQGFVASFAQKHRLTARETEVVALAAAGASREEILEKMGITRDTLKSHLRTLFQKTRERSLAALQLKLRRKIHDTE